MNTKALIIAGIASGLAFASPAQATGKWWGGSSTSGGKHSHYCGCGHKTCGSTTSSGGSTTSSGGSTTSSGGTSVPEPGMLGMLGLGLIGVGYARRRRTRK